MLPWLLALIVALAGLVYASRRKSRSRKVDRSEIEDAIKEAFRSRGSGELSRSCEEAARNMDSEEP